MIFRGIQAVQHMRDDLIRYLLCQFKTLHFLFKQSYEVLKLFTAGIQFRVLLFCLLRT